MGTGDEGQREGARAALAGLGSYTNMLFEDAPVMMHCINSTGRLLKVNRLWSQKLGYRRKDAVGRWSTEFLTDESRDRAMNDTLPLFWRSGSARSVGYRMVRRDGSLIDVQLDADLLVVPGGELRTYAALRDLEDGAQWKHSAALREQIGRLNDIQLKYEQVVSHVYSKEPAQLSAAGPSSATGDAIQTEVFARLVESAVDIASSTSAIARASEESASASDERHEELMLVTKSVDRTLTQLVDVVAELPARPSKPRPFSRVEL